MEYEVLINMYGCKVQEMYTVQDHPPPPPECLILPPLDSLYKAYVRNQELPQPGDSRPVRPSSQCALSQQMMKYWGPWETNMQKSQGCSSNCPFTRNKLLGQQVHKTLIHCLWPIMTTRPSCHSKCAHSSQVNHRLAP
jgi:hypothetical protein